MTKCVSTQCLADFLEDANCRTRELLLDLDDKQLMGPKLPIVNPILWEVGHVAWFYDQFILRMLYRKEPTLKNGDKLYDSIDIEHYDRWDLPLLSTPDVLDYIDTIRQKLIDRLGPISGSNMASEQDSFIYQFAVFHEDMHTEAYLYSRKTLEYPSPNLNTSKPLINSELQNEKLRGDVEIPGGKFLLGSQPDSPFFFDNEKWAHNVPSYPFKMARLPVTNKEFSEFVADNGYKRRDLWHDLGWNWRNRAEAEHPTYWVADGKNQWLEKSFDNYIKLVPNKPVSHVNWFEASAYCNWANRRLPTELEWEIAATSEPTDGGEKFSISKRPYPWGDDTNTIGKSNLDGRTIDTVDVNMFGEGDSPWGIRQMIGNIWEWTASNFEPYPGFSPDSYKEYSQPVFGTRKVLRGGSWATRSRMIKNTFRNFYTPERRDVIAGFRTCAPFDWT